MFWIMVKGKSNHVWAEPYEMGSMQGYLVQYVPSGNYVWCEKSCFERYFIPMMVV